MNIDEILVALQGAIDEMKEERERMLSLEEKVNALFTITEMLFAEHGHELPEKGE